MVEDSSGCVAATCLCCANCSAHPAPPLSQRGTSVEPPAFFHVLHLQDLIRFGAADLFADEQQGPADAGKRSRCLGWTTPAGMSCSVVGSRAHSCCVQQSLNLARHTTALWYLRLMLLAEPAAAAGGAGDGAAAPQPAAAAVVPARGERPMPTALKEHEAGRLGGQDHRAVVWADEAIDALLDRSGMEDEGAAQDAAAAAAAANDILAGFKVAHFELQDQPQEEGDDAAAEADAEAEAATVLGALETVGQARGFWETLLAEQRVRAQAATEEALGKGKRRRRQLMDAGNVDQLDALLRAAELSDGDNGSSGGGSSRQHSGSSDGSGRESGGEGGKEGRRLGGLACNWCVEQKGGVHGCCCCCHARNHTSNLHHWILPACRRGVPDGVRRGAAGGSR